MVQAGGQEHAVRLAQLGDFDPRPRVRAREALGHAPTLGCGGTPVVIQARSQQRSEKKGQLELALQQARYEAAPAQRQ